MKRNRMVRVLKFVPLAILLIAILGFVVMSLWNWLTPTLFGWHPINFWQALGILLLSKILFGGFRGGHAGGHMHGRHRMMERWEQMTPEEREKFRHAMQGRCGPFGEPTAEPKS